MDEKLTQGILSLAGYIRNQRRKISKRTTFTREEVENMWTKLESLAEGILHTADRIERERRIQEAAEHRKQAEEAEAKERENIKREQQAAGYNTRCHYHCQTINRHTGTTEHRCDIDYPLEHCSMNCPYATNVRAGRTKVYQVRINRNRG